MNQESVPAYYLVEHTVQKDGDYRCIKLEGDTAKITGYTGKTSTITIPEKLLGLTVTAIGDKAFSCCTSLVSVTSPDSVTTIGDNAFSGCFNLTSVTVGRNSYALEYCKEHDLPYTYSDANDWLNG